MVSLDLFLFHEFGLTSLTNVQSLSFFSHQKQENGGKTACQYKAAPLETEGILKDHKRAYRIFHELFQEFPDKGVDLHVMGRTAICHMQKTVDKVRIVPELFQIVKIKAQVEKDIAFMAFCSEIKFKMVILSEFA